MYHNRKYPVNIGHIRAILSLYKSSEHAEKNALDHDVDNLPISPVGIEKSCGSTWNFCTRCALDIALAFTRSMPFCIAAMIWN
jgi:hypothetical protein